MELADFQSGLEILENKLMSEKRGGDFNSKSNLTVKREESVKDMFAPLKLIVLNRG